MSLAQSKVDSWIAWLEKQGEHANFRNKIQIGDKVTRNEDGVLVNLSQLKRVAKPEQKPADVRTTGYWLVEDTEQKPWSKEDEDIIRLSIENLTELEDRYGKEYGKVGDCIDWLKSLKDRVQSQWKPSNEQIKVCKEVYADILSSKGFDLGTVNSELNRLEEKLKKLKEL